MSKFLSWLKDHFAISFCHPDKHFLVAVFGRLCIAVGTTLLDKHVTASAVFAVIDKEDN